MGDLTAKSKKKVTFGKAKVRLVFDYHNSDSTQSEDTDERTSREIAEIKVKHTQTQKQPKKSILKPTTSAVGLDSGVNVLQRVSKHTFEWDNMDKNFWEPAKHKRTGRKRQDPQSESNVSISQGKNVKREETLQKVKEESPKSHQTKKTSKVDQHTRVHANESTAESKYDLFKKDGKTLAIEENNNIISEDVNSMAFNSVTNEKDTNTNEKPSVKNNEKWEGITGYHKQGWKDFVGIYRGVEADWDQTRQSLSSIGVDVGEDKLQNPREFVAIMNMLLSMQKEKSDNQSVPGAQQENIVERPSDLQHDTDKFSPTQKETFYDSNSSPKIEGEQKSTPEIRVLGTNEEEPGIKEELMSAKLDTTHDKPAHSKAFKKFKMKGLISGKKENTNSKMRKDRSYSEDNLNYSPTTDCKRIDYEKSSSFDKFRRRMEMIRSNPSSNSPKFVKETRRKPKRSCSEDNLDYFSKFEVDKTAKKYDSSSKEDISCDTERECSSTGSSSTTYKERSYSDNNLDLPKRVSLDGSLERERSSSCTREGESGLLGEDLKHKNRERQKVVKRDSWFLTRKQKMKGESEKRSNLTEERNVIGGKGEEGGIDSERQLKMRVDISQTKSCDEGQEASSRKVPHVCEKSSSFDHFRRRMEMNRSNPSSNSSNSPKFVKETRRKPKRSCSEDNLDYFSRFEVEKTAKKYDSSSKEDISCDTERECSSTDSSSTTYKKRSYSDNNLDLPKRVSLDGSLERERSSSCTREGESGLLGEDLKHKNRERQKVVRRDSWFLTRKQKMKGESEKRSNQTEERNVTGEKGKEGGIDSERQLKMRGDITQTKSCDEGQEASSTSGSEFDNKNKSSKETIKSESSLKLEKRSNPKKAGRKKKQGGIDSERQLKITQRKTPNEIKDGSTSESEFDNRNISSKQKMKGESRPVNLEEKSNPKNEQNKKREEDIISERRLNITQSKSSEEVEDCASTTEFDIGSKSSNGKDHQEKTDLPNSKNRLTLLLISNQSGSEREDSETATPNDSGLSTSVSCDNINRYECERESTSNTVQNHNENTKGKHRNSKRVSNQFEEENSELATPNDNNSEQSTASCDTISIQEQKGKSTSNYADKHNENTKVIDSIIEKNQSTNEDEFLEQFKNDICFIDAEAKRSLRSEEYLKRARKRYCPKPNSCLETNLALKVMEAIGKNPAAGILLPFSN